MNTTSNTSNTANKTEIFNSYKDFLKREDKSINGVSVRFAEIYPNWESMNFNNIGCYNSYNCYNCYNCNNCNNCNDCNYCYNCNGCNSCSYCSHCNSCNDCNHCNSCSYCNAIARWKTDVTTANNVVNLLAIHGLLWPVAISETHMQIGCQNHSIAAWKRFSKSDLAHMGNTVIDFYKQNKQLILAAIAVKQSSVSQ